MNGTVKAAPAFISASEAYQETELRRRLGVGREAIREARRRGLVPRKIGKRLMYHGQDVLDFIAAAPAAAEPAERPPAAKE